MVFLSMVPLFLLGVLGMALPQETPPAGALPETLKIDWNRVADLEALISGLETEGTWLPHPKRPARKFGPATWGRHFKLEYDPKVLFPADTIDDEKERDFYFRFYGEYLSLHGRLLDQARERIRKFDLLPKETDLEDKKGRWIHKYLRKYRPGRPMKVSRKADLPRAETIRELSFLLEAVLRHGPLVRAALKRSKLDVRLELDRRKKVMNKWLRRYDVRPLAYAKTFGASVANVYLDPSIIKTVKEYIQRQRVVPVLTATGKRVLAEKDRFLYLSDDFGAREVFDFLREVTHEFFIARYMEKTNDGYRDALKVVGCRLLKDRTWFLFYNDRVVVMPERGLPKRPR